MHDHTSPRAALGRVALLALVVLALGRATAGSGPPSFVLIVLDTARYDAFSANGAEARTSPNFDRLAASGLRYTHAWAQAHWTLPSHASLFTGLLPHEHGVDWRAPRAPDDMRTLAEALRDGGYETFGLSENPWVSERLNMTQGFDHFAEPRQRTDDAEVALDRWLSTRPAARPFFAFVNLMDAHPPYEQRADQPFLPAGVSSEELRGAVGARRRFRLCESSFSERERAILRAQALLGVSQADARVGRIVDLVRGGFAPGPVVVVVTSDHGDLLGEHGFVDHQFGLWEELLRVPLVVSGLPAVAPSVIAAPVALIDVFPSVLAWAGLAPPAGMADRVLPTSSATQRAPRVIVAEHVDPEAAMGGQGATAMQAAAKAMRGACGPESGLFGDARAVVAWPEKLHHYASIPPRLFALDRDPGEGRDLALEQPARTAALAALVSPPIDATLAARGDPSRALPDGEIVDRLRAIGYLGGDSAGGR